MHSDATAITSTKTEIRSTVRFTGRIEKVRLLQEHGQTRPATACDAIARRPRSGTPRQGDRENDQKRLYATANSRRRTSQQISMRNMHGCDDELAHFKQSSELAAL